MMDWTTTFMASPFPPHQRGIEQRLLRGLPDRPADGCWLWARGQTGNGYGALKHGRHKHAHRVAYEVWVAPVPEGAHILHSCDVRLCCNPAHLRPGTNWENVRDRIERDGQPRGESVGGARLTEAQVREIRSSPLGLNALASEYGVGRVTIWSVRTRKTWAHIP